MDVYKLIFIAKKKTRKQIPNDKGVNFKIQWQHFSESFDELIKNGMNGLIFRKRIAFS